MTDFLRSIDYQSFKTIFLSIIFEAAPFLMLGVLISSLLQVSISEERLRRIIPKNPVIGLLVASLLGVLFPVCECGMIPVARRLIQKGMPAYLGITYMLAAPVLNPVVYFATYSAFRTRPDMVYSRMALGFGVAFSAGLLIYFFVRKNPLKLRADELRGAGAQTERMTLSGWAEHMLNDFFDMAKYLLFGAFIAACLQVFVARSTLIGIGAHSWSSYPFMMGLAYVLSLCSTSDAFVAASFSGAFSKGPLLAFMVLGPMLDFKSTLMLLSAFRFRFVAFLIASLIVLAGLGSVLAAWLG
jgi:uncharacterized protein